MIKLDYQYAADEEKIAHLYEQGKSATDLLLRGDGAGNDYIGWADLPVNFDKDEFEEIKKCASEIREKSQVLVVLGIGGSYLGAKAVVEALSGPFVNKRVIFAGNTMSSVYMNNLVKYLEDKDFSINIISKSGTTTESAIAFRILKKLLVKKYGEEKAAEYIYVTTDKEKGALLQSAKKSGNKIFTIPKNVGGRYSVLTAVGLLPVAVAGFDIDALMRGAKNGYKNYCNNRDDNIAKKYAIIRNYLHRSGKTIEMLVGYEMHLLYFIEWYKQLFGESEGKEGKGIFPSGAIYSTDLHSLGQYVQEGPSNLFETVLVVKQPQSDITIEYDQENIDGLNYLSGKGLDYVNKQAYKGTVMAHVKGGVPNIAIEIDRLDEENIGELIYFFEFACAVSGYMLGVNPFDQPGVEEYKKSMFALLGKE